MKKIVVVAFALVLTTNYAHGAESNSTSSEDDIAAGHSRHGEAFNEGPRQQAYLMPGTGDISFEVSSEVEGVRDFIEQGIGQLHGFWYFEAERSFRQAAMLDPECPMAYWGMAQANTNNEERAKKLIERAYELRDHASDREKLYIEALHAFLTGEKKKKEREADYVAAVEAIIEAHPEDLEAKGLLGYLLYKYRASAKKTHAEVDVILDQIHAKAKNHPAHHYRIHLWDHKSPQRALDSAARCGPAAPAIAHMWHMCGHIFSRVKRYGDAAWFQEASARVDHRHMMHDQVLPDQIHNFAHNNEWFIRNMMNVGRVREALALAKNMIELPRHPKYNMLDKRNSASYGRDRLMNVLERFELWDETVELADAAYLEPTDDEEEQVKRLRLLGRALAKLNRIAAAEQVTTQLQSQLTAIQAQAPSEDDNDEEEEEKEAKEEDIAALSKEEQEKRKEEKKKRDKEREKQQDEYKRRVERVERALASVSGHILAAQGEWSSALEKLEAAEENELAKAYVQLEVGDLEGAVENATKFAKARKKQVHALAGQTEILWRANRTAEARQAFIALRAHSNWIHPEESAIFARLTPIAAELGFPEQWYVRQPKPDDLGEQPDLDSLGPFRWQPPPAKDFLLPDSRGQLHSLRGYRGKPVVIVFYLGYGCLHCAEQLQALAPKAAEFKQAGIELIAISTDNLQDLDISQRNYVGNKMPFPLISDAPMQVFRDYRCFDDFEATPLHGTFLIDADGRIRWQDISYDPFMEIDFLLEESQRLLKQHVRPRPEPQRLVGNTP